MCRVQAVKYDPIPESVPQARQWLRGWLRAWELDQLAPDAALLVTELVTNAIVHAYSQVHVTAAVADGMLEVAVSDHEPRRSMPYSHETLSMSPLDDVSTLSEGGRGLGLVDAISDRWGVSTLEGGKQVWFRLSVDRKWAHLTRCPAIEATSNAQHWPPASSPLPLPLLEPGTADTRRHPNLHATLRLTGSAGMSSVLSKRIRAAT